jgi:polar amino acid transport system substrate-binding protein
MNIEMQLRKMKDPGLERAEPFEQPVESGTIRYGITSFAVRLEDKDLLDDINKHLLAFRGTPEYLAILEKYGLTEADLPPEGMTTAKVCASRRGARRDPRCRHSPEPGCHGGSDVADGAGG